jgi:hypothetical protein
VHNPVNKTECEVEIFVAGRDTPLVSRSNFTLRAGSIVRLRPSDWNTGGKATLAIETFGSDGTHRGDGDDDDDDQRPRRHREERDPHLESAARRVPPGPSLPDDSAEIQAAYHGMVRRLNTGRVPRRPTVVVRRSTPRCPLHLGPQFTAHRDGSSGDRP